MTQQWRIRIYGQPKRRPTIELLTQAVLELAEQLRRERDEPAKDESGAPLPREDDT